MIIGCLARDEAEKNHQNFQLDNALLLRHGLLKAKRDEGREAAIKSQMGLVSGRAADTRTVWLPTRAKQRDQWRDCRLGARGGWARTGILSHSWRPASMAKGEYRIERIAVDLPEAGRSRNGPSA